MVNETRRIQSVERALMLLEVIAANGGDASLAELAAQLGQDKGTMHGLLNTMAAMGYVSRRGTRYALGLRLRDLAQPLAETDAALRTAFMPALKALAERTGETCYLAVPCGTRDYLYIDVLEGAGGLCVARQRGRREGLTTSAIGKVFLAHDPDLVRTLRRAGHMPADLDGQLQTIVEQGYALDLEEAEPGLNCLALPLRMQGRVVAALGLAGPAQRLRKPVLRRLAATVIQDFFDIIKI